MPIADMTYVRNRRSTIWRVIRRSSPVVVCNGSFGVLLVAALRHPLVRIGKIQDRMACVSRGEMRAADIVHRIAAAEAYEAAHKRSRGDVPGKDLATAVSAVLASHYHAFAAEPLSVESIIVQLASMPEQDYLVYVGPDGEILPFEHIMILDSPAPQAPTAVPHDRRDERRDGRRGSRHRRTEEALDALNGRLRGAWSDQANLSEALAMLRAMTDLQHLLSGTARRDAVFLDRAALSRRAYDEVFHRITV